jgi:hypothetical protein
MRDLDRHFYSLGGGQTLLGDYETTSTSYASGASSYVLKPASGKKLVIMWYLVTFTDIGTASYVQIAFFDGEDDTTDPEGTTRLISKNTSAIAVIQPVFRKFYHAPIIGETDQVVKIKKVSTAAQANISMGGYEI